MKCVERRGVGLALVPFQLAGRLALARTVGTALVAICAAVPALAQASRDARWVVAGSFGGASGTKDLASSVNWRTGWSAGANLTYWLGRDLGVRASGTFARNDLQGSVGTIPDGSKFNKFSYLGEVVYQFRSGGTRALAPYAVGGLGAVSLHRTGTDSTFARFAGDLGLGVGYRLGRLGLRAEGRDLMYKFARYGVDRGQNDVVWDAGVTLGIGR